MAKEFFEHPLISSMIPGDYKPAPQWSRFFKRGKTWSEFFKNWFLSNFGLDVSQQKTRDVSRLKSPNCVRYLALT
ncbi:MAG: hypothetical protein NT121_01165 [Chloroflexi bacterium]|nr:hypothetical protein [Chloroflexota bacterium]